MEMIKREKKQVQKTHTYKYYFFAFKKGFKPAVWLCVVGGQNNKNITVVACCCCDFEKERVLSS